MMSKAVTMKILYQWNQNDPSEDKDEQDLIIGSYRKYEILTRTLHRWSKIGYNPCNQVNKIGERYD